jgi:hypothetical protein
VGTSLSDGFGYFSRYVSNQFIFFAGFWILAAIGMPIAFRNPAMRTRLVFTLGFFLFSFLGVTPGLYFREHYFVLLLPAFAIVVGMAVVFLQSILSKRMKFVPLTFLMGLLAWDSYLQKWAFFQLPPEILCRVVYGENPLLESAAAAKYIRDNSSPDARVAVIGSEPEIYFYAGRHSATGYIYTYPLMENQPYALTMQHRMAEEIESVGPEYLVMVVNRYSWLLKDSSNLAILNWAQNYAATNYGRVGIVDLRADKPQIELWGDDAKNYRGKPEQYLEIYRRKPDAN